MVVLESGVDAGTRQTYVKAQVRINAGDPFDALRAAQEVLPSFDVVSVNPE